MSSKDKGDECIAMLGVAFKRPDVELVAELGGQSLVEQDVGDHGPPGEREPAQHQAQRHVDQQLCKVMRTGQQAEPAPAGNTVLKGPHCS